MSMELKAPKKKPVRQRFIVEVAMPEGVSTTRMKEYVRSAVANYVGSQDPEEPIYALDQKSVKVI